MDRGWSIKPEDWKALEQILSVLQGWQQVLLTPNDQVVVPATPGVYAICAQPPNAVGSPTHSIFHHMATPLYIGRSESSIKSRFLVHCNSPDSRLRTAKRCYHQVPLQFWFVEMPVNAVRNTEGWLIRCFGPPANKVAGTISATLKPPVPA